MTPQETCGTIPEKWATRLGTFACSCFTVGFFGLIGPGIVMQFLVQLAPKFEQGIASHVLILTSFYMTLVGIPFGLHVGDLLARHILKKYYQKSNTPFFALSLFFTLVITYVDLFMPTEITRLADLTGIALTRFEFFYLLLVQGLPLLWFGYNLRTWYESRYSDLPRSARGVRTAVD